MNVCFAYRARVALALSSVSNFCTTTARIVSNHGTNIHTLIPFLQKLARCAGIKTLIPGRLGQNRGRDKVFRIAVTVPTPSGWKLVARKGDQAQEVFCVTNLNRDQLAKLVEQVSQR
ncbi:hypothetical protein CYMTET_13163 [Cymbomonas tetramitiformis]|uniref:Metal-binding protein n=1 Tax=Cymbomonas tetramitiformis TaxID=36881 RepID=A0AAE0GK80_9CHLO|nr:hypothetical protein CYMTET_13163 [Cymbomonas tetramitiformis]